jgi:hypothetical protein
MIGTMELVSPYVNFAVSIGTLIALVWGAIQWSKHHTISPWALIIGAGFVGIFVGHAIGQQAPILHPLDIAIPTTSTYTGSAEVNVTSIKYMPPATLFTEGTYNNVPEKQSVWLYIKATNGRFYPRVADMNTDGTWRTTRKTNIGDETKFGGTYDVGILLAEPGTCLDPNDTVGITELPTCATIIKTARVTRN